ncbi:MAG: polysaccharide biosynthesis tyrosine autokinase [Verrucomicrobia bacterium]|nr:polysaccharide biosynthesis tyrosine autokinase [Verrucomicrobiota bacterium]
MNTKTSSPIFNDSSALRIDIAQLCRELLSKSWLIILFVLLSLLAAVIYLVKTPPTYASRAVIEVDQEPQKVVNSQDRNRDDEDFKSEEELNTIAQSLMSDTLALRVIKANGLDQDPWFAPPKKSGVPYSDSELVGLFHKRLTVTLRRGTRLIDISVQHADPKRAQELTQSMVKEFVDQIFDQKLSVSKEANNFLTHQADTLKAKLHNSEQALQDYREKNHAVSLEDKQNITVEKLKDLNQKVTEARSQRLKLEADVAAIKQGKAKNPEQLLMLPSVADLPVVVALRQELADKESKFKNPEELRGLQESLNSTLLNAANMVVQSYQAAKTTEAKLSAELKDQESAALELDKIAIPYNVLLREVEADRALYDSVLAGMKETNLSQNLGQRFTIRVIASPMVPSSPVKPRKLLILALSLLGGFVVGSALVTGLMMMDSSVREVNQVEELLAVPVLTSIPRSKRKHLDRSPVVSSKPGSYEAEAFRSLRTGLSFLRAERDFKTFLFTSANPGEGKTYCSLNCAAALAQLGLRTLLIDADLRRPTLSKALLTSRKAPGLTACLTGRANLMDCLQTTDTENLFVLGAGERASKPAELLAAGDLVALLNEAKFNFDRIVIDSAPVNAVSDTQLIAKEIDLVFLVIRAAKTSRRSVSAACNHLARATHSPDAVILNRVVRRSRDHYHAARYARSYVTGAGHRKSGKLSKNGSISNGADLY